MFAGAAGCGAWLAAAASLDGPKSAPHFWQVALSGLLKAPHSMHLTAVTLVAGLKHMMSP